MVEPPRLTRALRDWAGDGPARALRGGGGELYRRYRDGLDAAGLVDEDLYAWRALEALRAEPEPGRARRCSSTASTTSPAGAAHARGAGRARAAPT